MLWEQSFFIRWTGIVSASHGGVRIKYGAAKMTQWIKPPAASSLTPGPKRCSVQSLGPKRWKDRTNSHRMPSHVYTHTLDQLTTSWNSSIRGSDISPGPLHSCAHTHNHTHTQINSFLLLLLFCFTPKISVSAPWRKVLLRSVFHST